MAPRTLSIGPFRCTGIARGLADVHFDGARLRLVCFSSGIDVLERYRLVLLALAATFALSCLYVDGSLGWIALGAAGLSLAAFLLVVVVEAIAKGRLVGTVVDIAENDIHLMDNVYGAFRPRLVLHTDDGRLTLAGWWWRRGQLERLQRRLAA
ncbi:hypothetical protein BH09ACT12_BH09ACT12_34350 [soil metagenome]